MKINDDCMHSKNFYNKVSLAFQDECSKDYSLPVKFDLVNSA